jgi:hypothetical protein
LLALVENGSVLGQAPTHVACHQQTSKAKDEQLKTKTLTIKYIGSHRIVSKVLGRLVPLGKHQGKA